MARVRKVMNFCDRHTTDEPSTTTMKFSLNGVDWEIDLCEQHADMLQRDIMGWARLAREKERPSMFRSSEEVRAYTHSNYGSGQHNGLDKKPVTREPAASALPALPAVADNWTLTPHAEEQLEERGPVFGFTRADVFLACVEPEHTMDAKGGRKHHYRGNVQLIVSPIDKKVVTVLPRSTRDFQEQEQELASAANS